MSLLVVPQVVDAITIFLEGIQIASGEAKTPVRRKGKAVVT